MHISKAVKCAVAGAAAGAANGFWGAGGGMLLVPILIRWAGIEERKAFATSVAVIFPLCAVSSVIYLFRTVISFSVLLPYLIGGFLGGAAGGFALKKLPVGLLRRIFGLLIIYGGIRSLI